MSNIYLSSDELISIASGMQSTCSSMESCFSSVRSQMHTMSSSWQSPAGEKCLQEFENFSPAFEQFTNLVNTYITYLRQTAQSYQENESMLSGAAG